MSETHIAINKAGIDLIFKMSIREANMAFHNDELLEQMKYLSIHIPKTKAKALNIYPIIRCKATPFYVLKAEFFTLMNDYTWQTALALIVHFIHFTWG